MPTPQPEDTLDAVKEVAAVLRDAGVGFAVGGGLAAWARGGPPTAHDIDFIIREEDVDAALEALSAAGIKTERPAEGWLVKAWHGDVLVDLIFRPSGLEVDDELLDRCDELNVEALTMPVMRIDDVLTSKLSALTEHHLDYGPSLEMARSLREQVDWAELRARTKDSPFARAFFVLAEDLGICPPEPSG